MKKLAVILLFVCVQGYAQEAGNTQASSTSNSSQKGKERLSSILSEDRNNTRSTNGGAEFSPENADNKGVTEAKSESVQNGNKTETTNSQTATNAEVSSKTGAANSPFENLNKDVADSSEASRERLSSVLPNRNNTQSTNGETENSSFENVNKDVATLSDSTSKPVENTSNNQNTSSQSQGQPQEKKRVGGWLSNLFGGSKTDKVDSSQPNSVSKKVESVEATNVSNGVTTQAEYQNLRPQAPQEGSSSQGTESAETESKTAEVTEAKPKEASSSQGTESAETESKTAEVTENKTREASSSQNREYGDRI